MAKNKSKKPDKRKSVFFTVKRLRENSEKKKTYCHTILDLLDKRRKAIVLELDEFNPEQDGDQVKDFVALFEPGPKKFRGHYQIVGETTPGLPPWARLARGRVLIGPKAVNSPENMVNCVDGILSAFPSRPALIAPEPVPAKKVEVSLPLRLWEMFKNKFGIRQH